MVIDGLRQSPHPTHMNLEEAVAAAQQIKATQTYLTHMTYFVDYEKTSAELPDGIALAYDGLSLNLSE